MRYTDHNGPTSHDMTDRQTDRQDRQTTVLWHRANRFTSGRPIKPGTQRVQALADISRSALCCHSNETHAPIANPPNRAQLESTLYTAPPTYICVHAVVWECGEVQTDRHTEVHRRPCPIYTSPRLRLARNVLTSLQFQPFSFIPVSMAIEA